MDFDQHKLYNLVKTIFSSSEPPQTGSFKIDLQTESELELTDEVERELKKKSDELMMNIFIVGVNELYGDIHPKDLTQEQLDKINSYLAAFSNQVNFHYEYNEQNIPIKLNVYFTPI